MNKNTLILVMIAVIAIIGGSIVSYVNMTHGDGGGWSAAEMQNDVVLGGVTNYDSLTLTPTTASEGLKVGTSTPTVVNNLIHGTCNLSSAGGSFVASTSQTFWCAVTGVAAGDRVLVTLPAAAGAASSNGGASSTFMGFVLNSSYATSSGMIGMSVANLTGAATGSFAQATTGVSYLIIR